MRWRSTLCGLMALAACGRSLDSPTTTGAAAPPDASSGPDAGAEAAAHDAGDAADASGYLCDDFERAIPAQPPATIWSSATVDPTSSLTITGAVGSRSLLVSCPAIGTATLRASRTMTDGEVGVHLRVEELTEQSPSAPPRQLLAIDGSPGPLGDNQELVSLFVSGHRAELVYNEQTSAAPPSFTNKRVGFALPDTPFDLEMVVRFAAKGTVSVRANGLDVMAPIVDTPLSLRQPVVYDLVFGLGDSLPGSTSTTAAGRFDDFCLRTSRP